MEIADNNYEEENNFDLLKRVRDWIKRNPGKVITIGFAVIGSIISVVSNSNIHGPSNKANKIPDVKEKPKEALYYGVPISGLDKIAKEVWHGERMSIDNSNFLNFRYRSKNGHQHFNSQFEVDTNGKLKKIMDRKFPGQFRSSADDFLEEVNKNYTFKK
ncbi:MAG: hypothetical protein IJS58_06740 [Bacilli bacterium]|nr:hypothetical protein [Bacilli bacterium]